MKWNEQIASKLDAHIACAKRKFKMSGDLFVSENERQSDREGEKEGESLICTLHVVFSIKNSKQLLNSYILTIPAEVIKQFFFTRIFVCVCLSVYELSVFSLEFQYNANIHW